MKLFLIVSNINIPYNIGLKLLLVNSNITFTYLPSSFNRKIGNTDSSNCSRSEFTKVCSNLSDLSVEDCNKTILQSFMQKYINNSVSYYMNLRLLVQKLNFSLFFIS